MLTQQTLDIHLFWLVAILAMSAAVFGFTMGLFTLFGLAVFSLRLTMIFAPSG